jgi:hypothetical protein
MVLHDHDFAPVAWLSAAVLVASLFIVLSGMRAESRRVIAAARTA